MPSIAPFLTLCLFRDVLFIGNPQHTHRGLCRWMRLAKATCIKKSWFGSQRLAHCPSPRCSVGYTAIHHTAPNHETNQKPTTTTARIGHWSVLVFLLTQWAYRGRELPRCACTTNTGAPPADDTHTHARS
nr:hypothetical protein [Pandoravirus aubagnensis]